jgi:hypothetical protein
MIFTPTPLMHPAVGHRPLRSSVHRDRTIGGASSKPTGPCPSVIKSGDVLVSQPTARADVYDVSVVPGGACISNTHYEEGLATGRQLAGELAVDGWFTCDHTHFMRIARHRP